MSDRPPLVCETALRSPSGTGVEAAPRWSAQEMAAVAGAMVRDGLRGGGDAPGRWVELLGRVGLIAYGALHALIAVLIVRTVLGAREYLDIDQNGAVALVAGLGATGLVLLGVALIGLVAFGIWQLCAAVTGFRWVNGSDRVRKRVGAAAKAVAVFSVAVITLPVLLGAPSNRAGADTRPPSASLLVLPGGRLLVGAIAVVAMIVAGSMLYTGARATFMGDLHRDRLSPGLRRTAVICGSVGNFARVPAFAGIGLSCAAAAITNDPARSAGVNGVLRILAITPLGLVGLAGIAAGITAFGIYCAIDAYARRA